VPGDLVIKKEENAMSENVRTCPVSKNRLSDAQAAAVALIATGKSFKHVCDSLSIDPRTLYRWRRERAFRRALDARRAELWHSAADRLRAMLDRSLDVFEEQLGEQFRPSRFRAANAILRIAGVRAAMEPARHGKKPRRKGL
jgi:transposase-like protein